MYKRGKFLSTCVTVCSSKLQPHAKDTQKGISTVKVLTNVRHAFRTIVLLN